MQKVRYFFDDGYGLVPNAHVKECRGRLVQVICPGRNGTFYEYLSRGVCNIRLPLYEAITDVISSYGVPKAKIWRKEVEE